MLEKAENAKQKHKKQMKKAKKRIHVLFEKCDKYGHGNLDADDIKRMIKRSKCTSLTMIFPLKTKYPRPYA